MTVEDSFETPFDTDSEAADSQEKTDVKVEADADAKVDDQAEAETQADPDLKAAREAWETSDPDADANLSEEERDELSSLAEPFVGQWKNLISTTNWEKGRIISQWREALIESGVDATQYSDEAWARRVGGVTAPHVGRLRRVHDRFGSTYTSYEGVYWSHFLAGLDWDDAPMWLEGASKESWSVSRMREKRWEENGAVESQRPTASEIVEVELDEGVTIPAQGGGSDKEYGDDSSGVATGPRYDEPDFGDEEELSAISKPDSATATMADDDDGEASNLTVQPFIGLPALPDDLTDAVEDLKLCVLRHKTDGWRDVTADDVQKYLEAIGVLLRS